MNRRSKAALEESLKQSLIANSLLKKTNRCPALSSQNAAINPNFRKSRTATKKLIRTSQDVHKEKASLTQFQAKNILFGLEHHPSQRETDVEKQRMREYSGSFLELTSKQLDMVTKKIANFKNMISKQHNLELNYQSCVIKAAEEKKVKYYNQNQVFNKNWNIHFNKLRKTFECNTRTRLQLLQAEKKPTPQKKKQEKNVETGRKTYPRGSISRSEYYRRRCAALKEMLKLFREFIHFIQLQENLF